MQGKRKGGVLNICYEENAKFTPDDINTEERQMRLRRERTVIIFPHKTTKHAQTRAGGDLTKCQHHQSVPVSTCYVVEAGSVKYSRKHFEPNDGINNNDKQDEESDVKQRNHCHQNSVYDNL